jgi:hypothetical protein
MKTHPPRFNALRLATLSMVAAGLVACGGDGGGGTPPPPTDLLDLTAANSDTVAHATAAALFAVGTASSAIPADAGSDAAAQAASLSALQQGGLGMSAAWLPQRVVEALVKLVGTDRQPTAGRQARALALTPMPVENCVISGTMTTTVDDRDNNGELSLNDLVTMAFSDCKDNASEVLNGSATVAVTSIGATVLPSFGASMSLMQLSQEATDHSHGLTVSGKLKLDYQQMSNTAERTRLTADGAVMVGAHTHQGYTDTVTLQSGFEQLSNYDASTGITRSDATGMLQSDAAGSGVLAVSTPQSIELADTDQYPRSGVVKVAGQGSMVLTVMSPSSLQIDLDADGDESYESRKTADWDWLF